MRELLAALHAVVKDGLCQTRYNENFSDPVLRKAPKSHRKIRRGVNNGTESTASANRPDRPHLTSCWPDPSQLKDYPIETVERLFSMHKELQQEAARREFNQAFNRVQQKMTAGRQKKGRNKHDNGSFYARAQEVSGAWLDPLILVEEGFSQVAFDG